MRHRSGSDYVGLGRSTMRLRATTRTFSSAGPAGNGHSKTAISRAPLHHLLLLLAALFSILLSEAAVYYRVDSFKRCTSLARNDPARVPRRVSPFRHPLLMDFENYSRALRLADARRFSDLKCEFSDLYAVFFFLSLAVETCWSCLLEFHRALVRSTIPTAGPPSKGTLSASSRYIV